MLPPGPKVAVTGGLDFNDHRLIWDKLDQVRAKHPDMVLLHGGSPKGAERIAAAWADNRKVPQIAFKPDWTRHAKAAPFKRNDVLLATLPVGVIVFPGTGIQDNLADKAKALGIPVIRFGRSGAWPPASCSTAAALAPSSPATPPRPWPITIRRPCARPSVSASSSPMPRRPAAWCSRSTRSAPPLLRSPP
ncbi:MAG: DUF2493 domain-containing protein [Telmatospirillum sp.]|nr:DUF2493 domain-containing protein [Telmatospirillum sp.]